MKVSIIGAGNVGTTSAQIIAIKEIASEIVLLDIVEGYAQGKAMDLAQSMPAIGSDAVIQPVTNDYSKTANSDVIVVTSGMPRKPGMTREELISINTSIVESVTKNAIKYSPDAIFIIVTNPLDTMVLVALKALNLPKNRIIGMGGVLDSNRFRYYISQKIQKPINDIEAMVIGGHGDTTMIPIKELAKYKGISVTDLISKDEFDQIVSQTMVGGATLTKLLGTSAWYAPGAAVAQLVDSIINDRQKLIPCSTLLEGEYGESDIFIGVPCIIGKNGIEKIVHINLTKEEKEEFSKSAQAIREVNKELQNILS